jgi:hypothetical protein
VGVVTYNTVCRRYHRHAISTPLRPLAVTVFTPPDTSPFFLLPMWKMRFDVGDMWTVLLSGRVLQGVSKLNAGVSDRVVA